MNVLICDPISLKGIEYFKQQPKLKVTVLDKRLPEAELIPLVANTEAMVAHSGAPDYAQSHRSRAQFARSRARRSGRR